METENYILPLKTILNEVYLTIQLRQIFILD